LLRVTLPRSEYPLMTDHPVKHVSAPHAQAAPMTLEVGTFNRAVQDHLGKQLRAAYAPKDGEPQELPSKLRDLASILDELGNRPR
jgi:hypothetical protein